jgi:hypothetical protein
MILYTLKYTHVKRNNSFTWKRFLKFTITPHVSMVISLLQLFSDTIFRHGRGPERLVFVLIFIKTNQILKALRITNEILKQQLRPFESF